MLRRLAKNILPSSVKRLLIRSLWKGAKAQYELSSGLKIKLTSNSDWHIYNETFVDRDYDSAIESAMCSVQGPINIVDLGANVGMFSLRAADILIRHGKQFSIVAVEGNPRTFDLLCENLASNDVLGGRYQALNGLVGRRSGVGCIEDSDFSGNNSVVTSGGKRVAYLDLSSILEKTPEIHLLKCDIEGSELDFLKSYPEIIENVKVGVFELHPRLCDAGECMERIKSAGLIHSRVLADKASVILVQFARQPATYKD